MTNGIKKSAAIFLCAAMIVTLFAGLSVINVSSAAVDPSTQPLVTITAFGGLNESAYVEWQNPTAVSEYNVYVRPENGTYTKIDKELVRYYGSYYRADALGLKAGKYQLKVAAVINGEEKDSKETGVLDVKAHIREGYAFDAGSPNKTGSGGYNDDGTVPDDAQIIYVTKDNVKTVTLDVIDNVNKGTTTTCVGLGSILAARGKKTNGVPRDQRHLIIRFIGTVTENDIGETVKNGYTGLNDNGYLEVKDCINVTVEGVGVDATVFGWGVLVRQANNVEVRNLGVMQFPDDGISIDSTNYNIWVHHCDIFYGRPGSDADQIKGDGSLDVKKYSDWCSFSFNHFWDSGKSSLCGVKEDNYKGYHMTYHHNWFDHSDSRHPRIRGDLVHVYNNYYDGNCKYGVGATQGANVFVENNYFRNVKYPVLISMQGSDVAGGGKGTFSSDDGAMVKMFGNEIEKGSQSHDVINAKNAPVEFDAYIADTRDEKVPDTYKAKQGGTIYNNFDTEGMYSYKADAAKDVPKIVMADAGRVGGGDFKWKFDNAIEDENDAIIPGLSNALKAYTSPLVSPAGVEDYYPATTDGPVPTTAPTQEPIQPTATPETTPAPTATPEATTAPTEPPVNDGYAITGASAGGAGLDVIVTYGGQSAPTGTLYAVKYDEFGFMIDFKAGAQVIGAGTYTIPGFTVNDGETYKILLWSDLEKAQPLCNSFPN